MILKKPYAFLIKHFKLIHLIICALLVYIAYKCNDLLYYFTKYINAGYYIKIGDVVGEYINIYLYISLFLVLLLVMTILILLHIKEKSNKVYGLIFVAYVMIAGLVISGHFNLIDMQLEVIDFRKVRLYKDMLFVSMFVQYITIIFTLIRGLGFNIKKFNFESELEEMSISASDNAEFELTVELNTNTFARKLRKQKRHLKYVFVEHKNIFILIGIIIILTASAITFISIGTKNFSYKQDTTVKINENTIVVNESYLTDKNHNGKIINKEKNYIVVNIDIKNTSEKTSGLDFEKFSLIVDKYKYMPIKKYEEEFSDIGEYYKSNKIKSNDVKSYILVFEIPKERTSDNYIFRYSVAQVKNNETQDKNFDIKLKPISSWIEQDIDSKNMGETIRLAKSTLEDTEITINNYEIKDNFNVKYDYCINEICNPITTNILPGDLSQNKRTILKLNLSIKHNEKVTSKYITDKATFISGFSKLKYVIEDKTYEDSTILNVTPKELANGENIYLDVDNNIKNATKISLIIYIRGNIYTYNLLEQ